MQRGAHRVPEGDELLWARAPGVRRLPGGAPPSAVEPGSRRRRLRQAVDDLAAGGIEGVVQLDGERLVAQRAGVRGTYLMVTLLDIR